MGAATTHAMPRRVTVLGAGLSGRAAARLAIRLGAERVTLTFRVSVDVAGRLDGRTPKVRIVEKRCAPLGRRIGA